MGKGLSFSYMYKDDVMATVSLSDGKVEVVNYSNFPLDLPFPRNVDLTLADVIDLFKERCFPETRHNCKELLKSLGLERYDEFDIVRKTHGLQLEDKYWIRFKGEENLRYEGIRKEAGLPL